MPRVLITGGTGFIASHCIKLLLERGYSVVTTVRSKSKGDRVLNAFANIAKGNLSYTLVEDVATKGAFDEAVKSNPKFDFVIHTTSPFFFGVKDPVKEMLEPSITGTTNILEAIKAHAPSVKRTVLLSSIASVRDRDKEPLAYDETYWNPVTWDQAIADSSKTYQGSKTLAERAAWDFMDREKPAFDLVTILPALVLGPVALHLGPGDAESVNTSNLRVLDMARGKMKDELVRTSFYTWADVRDVATAHVNALERSEAGNKRFLIYAGDVMNKDIAKIVAGVDVKYAQNLPQNLDSLPDDIPEPKDRYTVDNTRSVEILGVKYRSLQECIRDTVESFKRIL